MGTEHLLLCSEEPSTDLWPQTVKSLPEHNISPPSSLSVFLFLHNCHPLLRNQHVPCMNLSVHLTVFQSRWRRRQYVTPKVGTFPARRHESSANQPSSEHRSRKHANTNREAHFFSGATSKFWSHKAVLLKLFFRRGTPKTIVHIPRSPCLWKQKQKLYRELFTFARRLLQYFHCQTIILAIFRGIFIIFCCISKQLYLFHYFSSNP